MFAHVFTPVFGDIWCMKKRCVSTMCMDALYLTYSTSHNHFDGMARRSRFLPSVWFWPMKSTILHSTYWTPFLLVVWKKVLWIEVSATVFIFHEWRDKEKKARLRIKHFPYRRNVASTETLLTHLMTGNSRTIEIKFKSLVKPYRLRRAKVHNLLSIFFWSVRSFSAR